MTAALEATKGLRATHHAPMLNWLTNDGTNFVDYEDVGQALLILMLWDSADRFEESSRRLEGLTFALLLLTVGLFVAAIALFFIPN